MPQDERGILTEADIESLRGERDFNQSANKSDAKRRIRGRVAAALEDFRLLNENWDAEQQQKTVEQVDLEECAAEIIEFLYVAIGRRARAGGHPPSDVADQSLAFRRALSRGIRSGKQHFGEDPGPVLIDSNVNLFELPSLEKVYDAIGEDWEKAVTYGEGDAEDATGSEAVDRKEMEGAQIYRNDIIREIEQWLYHRRYSTDSEINRHETSGGSVNWERYEEDE